MARLSRFRWPSYTGEMVATFRFPRLVRRRPRVTWTHAAAAGLGGAAGAFVVTGGALSLGARIMARVPLVPNPGPSTKTTFAVRATFEKVVHLDATAETTRPHVMTLRQKGGGSMLRVGPVLRRPTPTTVARPILGNDGEDTPEVGPGSSYGYYWSGSPQQAFGFPTEDVTVDSPVGQMPAWLVRPDPPQHQSKDVTAAREKKTAPSASPETWAILIHGHGATREETLRAVPLLRSLGLTSLIITYRNDAGAPASADRMYHLGSQEWEDADAAIAYAISQGARRIVLCGWSMGGGIALRTMVRSEYADLIAAAVLVSPAVDWTEILHHHAAALKAPPILRRLALWMMSSRRGAKIVQLREPIALDEMRADFYAPRLRVPILITHGTDDATVPIDGSIRLASMRPELVDLEIFKNTPHTREWNMDPERFERRVLHYLVDRLQIDQDPQSVPIPAYDPFAPSRSRR